MHNDIKITIICIHCQTQFSVPPYRANEAHFCSRACHNAAGRTSCICVICGKAFDIQKNEVGRRVTCSRDCMCKKRAQVTKEWNLRYQPSPMSRFWKFIAYNDTTGCWLWVGSVGPDGYAHFHWNDLSHRHIGLAHRFSYEHFIGPVPDDMELDHLCRNRSCVNFKHLEPVTRAENIRRGKNGVLRQAKASCPHGHPYSPENTYLDKQTGVKQCRTCHRIRSAARYHAKMNTPMQKHCV